MDIIVKKENSYVSEHFVFSHTRHSVFKVMKLMSFFSSHDNTSKGNDHLEPAHQTSHPLSHSPL